jgi:hypothetical protein
MHLFYNEIMLISRISIPTIILIKPVFYANSFDTHKHGSKLPKVSYAGHSVLDQESASEVSASSATLLLLTQNLVVLHRPVESTANRCQSGTGAFDPGCVKTF